VAELISAEHIGMATKYIRRLSVVLHMSFYIRYIKTFDSDKQAEMKRKIMASEHPDSDWIGFKKFLEEGRQRNGTFSLHYDLIIHCDEVSNIALAERLGGKLGYSLLLASVKSSLPFSFMNGASSNAAFTTKLLHEYYRCGPYYKNMKHALFSNSI
jgi:hypothetical protein